LHVELTTGEGAASLRVTGLPAGTAAALVSGDPARLARRVVVATDEVVAHARAGRGVLGFDASLPALAGRFTADGDALAFAPRYPLLPGTRYRVLLHRSLDGDERDPFSFELDDYREFEVAIPDPTGEPTTRVTAIHPTAPTVPRNLLKLYVSFSAPMSEGEVARRITVRRAASGEPIANAFLPMEPELWDRSRSRVTVLFDPARIKRGLAPHAAIGYPLVEGETVEVVVDPGFRDGDGRPLIKGAARRYTVGPDVRRRVDPDDWRIAAPAAGTRAPLVVDFDRPLDRALLHHCLGVGAGAARSLTGRVEIADGETRWSFVPDTPWVAGRHELAVDGILEDLAGNSVVRVFDRELAREDHDPEPGTGSARTFLVS
jgi:hypothetical protein